MTEEKRRRGLSYRTPCRRAAGIVLAERAAEMARHEEGTRRGEDIEALHDMRVASRRLREALQIFGDFYPEEQTAPLYKRARRITRALGPVRNQDVMIEFLTAFRAERGLEEREIQALDFLLERARNKRERFRQRMIRRLEKTDAAKLTADITALCETPPERAARGAAPAMRPGEPLFIHGQHLLAERATEMVAAWQHAAANRIDEASLHQLRIAFKRLRYAVEIFRPIFGGKYNAVYRQMKSFQSVTGDIHDLDVFAGDIGRRARKAAKQGVNSPLAVGMRRLQRRLARRRVLLEREFRKLGRATPPRQIVASLHAAFKHPG